MPLQRDTTMTETMNRKSVFETNPKKTLVLILFLVFGFLEIICWGLLQVLDTKPDNNDNFQIFDSFTQYQYNPNQKALLEFVNLSQPSPFETEEHGWVRTDAQPKTFKRKIVLLGGSTVFGVGASSDKKTIASQLQKLLNQKWPNQYIVYNAGVRGFFSFQEYMFYLDRVRKIDPDIIISFNGRNDAYLASKERLTNNFSTDYSSNIESAIIYYFPSQKQSEFSDLKKVIRTGINRILARTNIGKIRMLLMQRLTLNSHNKSEEKTKAESKLYSIRYNPSKDQLESAAKNYIYIMKILTSAIKFEHKKHIWILQPISTIDKILTSTEEKQIANSNYLHEIKNYKSATRSFYDYVKKNSTVVTDFSKVFSKRTETLYTDDCHYNDEGNQIIASEIAKLLEAD